MNEQVFRLLAVSAIVCIASMIKGAIGFGFPLVAVPLLSAILGPRTAIPVVAVPTLLSNVLVIRRTRAAGTGRSLWALLVALAAGTLAGALLLGSLDARVLSGVVGIVALLYVLATALHLTVRVSAASVPGVGILFGAVAGLMGGATGISSPLLASYLHLLRLGKREFVFWMTVTFFVVNVVQVATYLRLGLYVPAVVVLAVIACVPMAIGTQAGLAVQDRLPPKAFERIVLAVVFAAGLNLVVRSLR